MPLVKVAQRIVPELRRSWRTHAALVSAYALHSLPASGAPDTAAARELFERGATALQAGRLDEACPALAESLRLDRRVGTLFTLAECEVAWGKLASARAHYQQFLSEVEGVKGAAPKKQKERVRLAREALSTVEQSVPWLTLTLPKDAPAHARVELDGIVLGAAALGSPIPIDPGRHRVTMKVDDAVRSYELEVAAGERKTLTLELPAPPSAPAPTPAAASPPKPEARALPAPAERRPSRGARAAASHAPWTWVALGVGAVGLGVGSYAGIKALGEKSTVDDLCSDHVCRSGGANAAERGQRYALVSTVAFGVGAAALATSAVLFLTDPPRERASTARLRIVTAGALPGGGFVSLGGHLE